MREYYPGASVRFLITSSALGVLYTPAIISVTLQQPPGYTGVPISLTASVVVDSAGAAHADTVLPTNITPGPWNAIVQATGPATSDNGADQERFYVKALGT